MTKKGAVIVASVAGMFAAAAPVVVKAAAGDKVHCAGINECKGKGSCHSAASACRGKNACKGKGWIETTEKECKDKNGTVVTAAPAK